MELTHCGESYLLLVRNLLSLDDLPSTSNQLILDLRGIDVEKIVSEIPRFMNLIVDQRIAFIWINCSDGRFMEIKARLTKQASENLSDIKRTFLKVTKHDLCQSPQRSIEISFQVKSFGDILPNIKILTMAHPRLISIDGISMNTPNNEHHYRKRKNDDEADEVSTISKKCAFVDCRRPKKNILKALYRLSRTENGEEKPRTIRCYMCSTGTSTDSQICRDCHDLNRSMKIKRCDLRGRVAIVTGGRIKIGFETALRLLRDGCHVVVTTRFPADASKRFNKETDFEEWCQRIEIVRLDLKDMRSINEFLTFAEKQLPHLDILVNNAAQTIHRPSPYYSSLISNELKSLAVEELPLVVNKTQAVVQLNSLSTSQFLTWEKEFTHFQEKDLSHFPPGKKDEHGEQLDLRPRNSWTYNMDEVPLTELLQVLAINTVAPYILTSKLKPLLKKSPFERKFVVNVSAMEGQFSRATKGHRHPHTNMAKAALNMMTRTSGLEFQMDGIYMTSVDTGWVTDERPHHQAKHEADTKGFVPPLDCQDGAARVYHPVIHGLEKDTDMPYFAVFLKDFKPKNW